MASVTRISNSALRASLRAPAFNGRVAAYAGARYYSAKTQVRTDPLRLGFNPIPCRGPSRRTQSLTYIVDP